MELKTWLINHYLKEISAANQKHIKGLTPGAMASLKSYHWPGNVRELINILQYSAITCTEDTISTKHLPEHISSGHDGRIRNSDNPDEKEEILSHRRMTDDQDETNRILDALKLHNFNRTKTAAHLSISRVGLWKKMKRLGVEV